MGWSVGYENGRDIGYGVPAICDEPDCEADIDRGLDYRCGEYNSNEGCGLYFCSKHLWLVGGFDSYVCERCALGEPPYEPKPDTQEWIDWKMTDESWAQWRRENGYE